MSRARSRGSRAVHRLRPQAIERRFGTRDELLEQAAEASRAGIRTRRERIVAGARPILHSAVAASLAWLIATDVIGHEQPFFAPISAVITLGLTVGQRRRRALELAIGVAMGIAIADALVALIGTGTWQVAVVVALAMTTAALVGGGPTLVSQASASAVLVATLQPPDGGFDFDRALDALVGGGVALAVSSLLLPVQPMRLVEESAKPVLERLVAALGQIATALTTRRPEAADAALVAVAHVDDAHENLLETLEAAGEAARLSPQRRRSLGGIDRFAVAAGELGRAIENVRALARGAVRATNLDDAIPVEAVQAVQQLARAAEALGDYLEGADPELAREAPVYAAALANAVLDATGNLSAVHIVGQIRLVAVDLLRATGLERAEAQEAVRTAALEA
ncbi:MAG TPA: FUSC family protein [Thermoleophilaceae bacterium]|nr:FUSC family protein [Thermoleophilaceae bacterium]